VTAKLTGVLPAAQFPALTGDVTTVAGALATTLAASGVSGTTCGDTTHSCGLTYNSKGLVTAATNNVIAGGGGGGTVTNYYGSMVQLGQVVTSGSASIITFSSIPAGYTDLVIIFNGRATGAVGDAEMYLKMNSDTTAANYQATQYLIGRTTTPLTGTIASTTSGADILGLPGSTGQANPSTFATITIPGYSQTTLQKGCVASYGNLRSGGFDIAMRAGQWLSTAAISTLTLTIASGSYLNGTTATLYGLGGTASSTVGTVTVGRVTADLTNATTTFSNVTGIGPTLVAAHNYTGKLSIKCNNSVAGEGIKLDFNGGTATATSFWAAGNQIVGGTDVLGTGISTSLAGVINFTTITGETLIELTFSMVTNAGGTFIPRFAENSHVTGTVTLELGSFAQIQDSP
jgi:hypothetical protein